MGSVLINSERSALLREEDTILFQEHNFSDTEIKRLRKLESTTRGVMQKYQAAMKQMKVRLEVLDQDLNLRQNRNPIHHIESRLKTVPSIFEKLQRYGKNSTLEDMESHVMDIAGLRVICSYGHDVYRLLDGLQAQEDLEIVAIKDYIANPKPNGYRSLHAILRVPVHFLDKREDVPVEVQIRTIAMDFWASLEHDLKYKADGEIVGVDSSSVLKECSTIIEDVEARMQVLAEAMDAGQRDTND